MDVCCSGFGWPYQNAPADIIQPGIDHSRGKGGNKDADWKVRPHEAHLTVDKHNVEQEQSKSASK